jgi:hypothetical protein
MLLLVYHEREKKHIAAVKVTRCALLNTQFLAGRASH